MKTDKKEEEKKETENQKEEENPEVKEDLNKEEKPKKYINPELLNDDLEESAKIEQIALQAKPYFSSNILPKSIYLQQNVLPLIYEALNQTEKKRPKDPIEFFAVYLLDHNKQNQNKTNSLLLFEKPCLPVRFLDGGL
ncbi:MAG: hypothetical protein II655_09055 [Thermoguttaceae bacterium]|nr:hypothetical protein [Thermoguttaceae bacterium]